MGRIFKSAANLVSLLLMGPFAALYHLCAGVARSRTEPTFQGFSQFVSLFPGLPGDYLRRAFLRMTCRDCAADVSIGFGTIFASPVVEIGPGVYVGPLCSIGHAVLERDVMVGTGVHLLGGGRAHGMASPDLPMRLQPRNVTVIRLGEDCWIGNGAIVMADVGAHAVVGAGAVVTKPVPSWMVVAGNPARLLRDRRDVPPPPDDGVLAK